MSIGVLLWLGLGDVSVQLSAALWWQTSVKGKAGDECCMIRPTWWLEKRSTWGDLVLFSVKTTCQKSSTWLLDWGAREQQKRRKHLCNEQKSGASNRLMEYLSYPVKSLQTTLKMHWNLINILNEVLVQSVTHSTKHGLHTRELIKHKALALKWKLKANSCWI